MDDPNKNRSTRMGTFGIFESQKIGCRNFFLSARNPQSPLRRNGVEIATPRSWKFRLAIRNTSKTRALGSPQRPPRMLGLVAVVSLPRFPFELLCSGCPTEFPRSDCVVLSPPHHDPLRQPVCSAGRAPVGCRAIPLLPTSCSIQVSS